MFSTRYKIFFFLILKFYKSKQFSYLPVRGRVPSRRYQRVDKNIYWNDVHSELLVTNNTSDRPSSDFHHDARYAAHVVHPSFERFSPSGGHLKHYKYFLLLLCYQLIQFIILIGSLDCLGSPSTAWGLS